METFRNLPDSELVERLRRAAGTWFKNTDLLLLEELIRRFRQPMEVRPDSQRGPPVR